MSSESLPDLLDEALFSHASGDIVLVEGDRRLTRAEVARRVTRVAGALAERGYSAGDRFAIWGANSLEWCISALAGSWLGMVSIPLSRAHEPRDLAPLLSLLRPPLFLVGDGVSGQALMAELGGGRSWPVRPEVIRIGRDAEPTELTLAQSESSDVPPERFGFSARRPIDPEETATILRTSGTTGEPKGVAHSHRSRVAYLRRVTQAPLRSALCAPLAHALGQTQLYKGLLSGGYLVLADGRTPQALAELLARERIEYLSGLPSLFERLLAMSVDGRPALGSLREVVLAAAAIPEALVRALQDMGVERIVRSYAMSECLGMARSSSDDDPSAFTRTVGRVVPGVELQIVDDAGCPVSAGTVGEICVKGDRLFQGYIGPEGEPVAATDAEGWFRTGDLGTFDAAGYLRIAGRRKEMFISHGHNVFPLEVENKLLESGLLKSAAVIGRPSRLAGEEGIAFVVPADPHGFDLAALREFARLRLPRHACPVRYRTMDALPLNANGKIDKQALASTMTSAPSL